MIAENIAAIKKGIADAAKKAGRKPEEIVLVAVSKTFPEEDILEAYEAGLRIFGENKIQDAVKKAENLKNYEGLEIHFIGTIQTNKVKYIKNNFSLIHSVDRVELLDTMQNRFEKDGHTQNILLQVNTASDPNKSGVSPDDAESLLVHALKCDNLIVRGITMIPPWEDDPEINRKYFRETKELFDILKDKYKSEKNILFDTLSMGMSDDFHIAIEEGSTHVRIGTAIFGGRNYTV